MPSVIRKQPGTEEIRKYIQIDITHKEIEVWEEIDVWINTIETSSWHRHEIRSLYHNAPQSIRNVHPFRIDPDGRIHDCWRWLIYSGYKPK